MKTADVNRDGYLNDDEIFELCKICLSQYMHSDQ